MPLGSDLSSEAPKVNISLVLLVLQHSYDYTQQGLKSLKRTVSAARLSTYKARVDGDLAQAISLYQLNISLSQALYLPLQMLEVSLRNVISKSIENIFGIHWFNEQKFINILKSKDDWMRKSLREAVRVSKNHCHPKNVAAGDVISRLTFGFWRELLKSHYKPHIWTKQLSIAFPNLPHYKYRQDIYNRVDQALKLRNRISHHEPIIKRSRRLDNEYQFILGTIGWMCLDTKKWTEYHSNFAEIYQKIPPNYHQKVGKPIVKKRK